MIGQYRYMYDVIDQILEYDRLVEIEKRYPIHKHYQNVYQIIQPKYESNSNNLIGPINYMSHIFSFDESYLVHFHFYRYKEQNIMMRNALL